MMYSAQVEFTSTPSILNIYCYLHTIGYDEIRDQIVNKELGEC